MKHLGIYPIVIGVALIAVCLVLDLPDSTEFGMGGMFLIGIGAVQFILEDH